MSVLGKSGHGETSDLATFAQGHVPVRRGAPGLHVEGTVRSSEAIRLWPETVDPREFL
jgi:hypothetical protein